MTTPPTNSDSGAASAVPVAKPGVPRAVILGGAVVLIAGLAVAAFPFIKSLTGGEVAEETPPPVIPPARTPPRPAPPVPGKTPVSATAAAKQQAAQALGNLGDSRIRLETSFDGVPVTLGGTGKRIYPPTPKPAADNGGKVNPIVQGRVPTGLRPDPFLSRLIVPISREYAYSLAVPYRLAPPARPLPPPPPAKIDPELLLGPLRYPGRVAGFLEFGGVSAILETGGLGTGEINIVQPGSTVASGIAGLPNLTVESISSTELVLRAEDGRSTKVALSGVPGGVANPTPPGGQGGPPPGVPGRPAQGGGRGGGGGAAATAE